MSLQDQKREKIKKTKKNGKNEKYMFWNIFTINSWRGGLRIVRNIWFTTS